MLVIGKLNNRAQKPPGAIIRQNLFCPFFFVIAVFAALVMSPWTPNETRKSVSCQFQSHGIYPGLVSCIFMSE